MKIIIVDDDCLVSGALKTILEANPDIQVAATGSDGEEACSLYTEYLPDILLMDIRMKGMDGLEASRKILGEFPEAKILLLTTFSDDEYIKKLSEVCDIGNLREILEKAAFSAEDISESELLCCLYIMNEIASKIRAERSLHCLYFELNLLQNFIIEKTK